MKQIHGVDHYDATFAQDLQFALAVHRDLEELDDLPTEENDDE